MRTILRIYSWLYRWWPLIGGIVIASVYLRFFRETFVGDKAAELVKASVAISAIAVGFLANLKATMFTIDDKPIIRKLKASPFWKQVIDGLIGAIRIGFVLAIYATAGYIIKFDPMTHWHEAYFAVWIMLASASVFAYYRVIGVFGHILRF